MTSELDRHCIHTYDNGILMIMVYICWYCPTGYVQGMSDMLAPILYVVDNEVDAFWCFAGLMERMVSVI